MELNILTTSTETMVFLGLSIAAIYAIYRLYRLRHEGLKKQTLALLCLRIAAFVSIALLAFNPEISYERIEKPDGHVLFVFDTSASMGFKCENPGVPRLENALTALKRSGAIEKIAGSNKISYACFSSEYNETGTLQNIERMKPSGTTDISAALANIMKKNEISAAVLVSDGRSTGEQPPEAMAKFLKTPVYTLGIGAGESFKDIAITEVNYPKTCYLNEKTELTVNIEQSGFDGTNTALNLKQDNQNISQSPLNLSAKTSTARISFIPKKAGLVKYECSINPEAGEISEENNVHPFFVNVIEHKIRVLYIAAFPDANFSYLVKFLSSNKDISFSYRFLNALNQSRQLTSNDFKGKADILILANIDFTSLQPSTAGQLSDYISEKRPAILFIGGPNFKISKKDPIAEWLPFTPDEEIVYEPLRYKPEPNPSSSAPQITKISPVAKINSYIWSDIPIICGINFIRTSIAPASLPASEIVLKAAITPSGSKKSGDAPVLIVKNSGGKKIAAIMGDSFWFLKSGQLFSKNPNFYDRLMGNLLLWLYSREDHLVFKVETDRANYYSDEMAFVSINARNQDFSPMPAPVFNIYSLGANGEKTSIQAQPVMIEAGYYEFSFKTQKAGEWELRVEATDSAGKTQAASARFTTLNSSREFLNYSADYATLKEISNKSGGKFYEPENYASLASDIPANGGEKIVKVRFKPFENTYVFFVILIALAAEWAIRRYIGFE